MKKYKIIPICFCGIEQQWALEEKSECFGRWEQVMHSAVKEEIEQMLDHLCSGTKTYNVHKKEK